MYVLVIYYKHYNRRIKNMSGIVGSYFNTRGSGVVAKLGTDGQVFTSTGAGLSQGFEDAAGGGAWNLIKQIDASSSATINFVNGTSDVKFAFVAV